MRPREKPPQMNPNFRNFALWVIIFLLVLALVTLFQNPGHRSGGSDIAYSQLLNEADNGRISNVVISGQEISGTFTDGRTFTTYAPFDPGLVSTPWARSSRASSRSAPRRACRSRPGRPPTTRPGSSRSWLTGCRSSS